MGQRKLRLSCPQRAAIRLGGANPRAAQSHEHRTVRRPVSAAGLATSIDDCKERLARLAAFGRVGQRSITQQPLSARIERMRLRPLRLVTLTTALPLQCDLPVE